MNSVQRIQSLVLNKEMTIDDKVALSKLPPPLPDLQLVVNYGCGNRLFRRNHYNLTDWLCGCDVKNAYFCYVCLIMEETSSSWTTTGFTSLKNFTPAVRKHAVSLRHLKNYIDVARMRKADVTDPLSHVDSVQEVEVVKQNRSILIKMINIIKSCQTGEKVNGSDNYKFSKDFNDILRDHVYKDSNSVFISLAENIQDDLLEAIYNVCLKLVSEEVSQTNYVAMQIDEICAFAVQRFVVVLRYELNGQIFERFIGFQNPEENTTECLSDGILHALTKVNLDSTPGKVISQSFNAGHSFFNKIEIHAKIKSFYQNATAIHSYSHEVQSLVKNVASRKKEVKVFFANVEAFSNFFTSSKIYLATLDMIVKKSSLAYTKLDFNKSCLNRLSDYKICIDECLDQIINLEVEELMISKAAALKYTLRDESFNFWLQFFNKIMPFCDLLNAELLQLSVPDIYVNAEQYVSAFKFKLLAVKDETGRSMRKRENTLTETVKRKKPRVEHHLESIGEQIKEEITIEETDLLQELAEIENGFTKEKDNNIGDVERKAIASRVCDHIISTIVEHFSYSDHLAASTLLEPSCFNRYKKKFPFRLYEIAVKSYKLDKFIFKNELLTLFGGSFDSVKTIFKLLQYFYEYNLLHAFPETTKFLKIMCTIPVMTTEPERCFDTLTRVKTFLRSRDGKDKQMSALAMCCLEKKLMYNDAKFDDMVIEEFSRKKGVAMSFLHQ